MYELPLHENWELKFNCWNLSLPWFLCAIKINVARLDILLWVWGITMLEGHYRLFQPLNNSLVKIYFTNILQIYWTGRIKGIMIWPSEASFLYKGPHRTGFRQVCSQIFLYDSWLLVMSIRVLIRKSQHIMQANNNSANYKNTFYITQQARKLTHKHITNGSHSGTLMIVLTFIP